VSLQKYHAKRHFNQTPEPRGTKARRSGALRFVVQKHDASRLHYDFRLELGGVMKSWAVPKGPSLNPADKRLAIMVEDHPLDYRKFEGTIPAGNYGAGTVIVWDEGTYEPAEQSASSSPDQLLRDGLESGHLGIMLHGSKLNGSFSLVKLQRAKKNEWLLIKKNDAFATEADVTEHDRSVTTGRDLDEVAHHRNPRAKRPRKGPPVSANGRHAAHSAHVKPMLATLVDAPFDRRGWLFEVKWDGYRAIAEVGTNGVELYSRNDKSFAERFAPIVESLKKLKHEAILDGEIVAVDEEGISSFQLLQNYQKTGKGNLHYFVFDLLSLDSRDLRALPLEDRKRLLAKTVKGLARVSYSEHILESGIAFFEAAEAKGLEGIIAKNASSTYREGMRGHDWLKIKTHARQEAVIAGFTQPRGSRKDIGALVLGVYEGSDLRYIGHAGGGLGAQALAELRARLDPLVQKECPFVRKPKTNMPVQWVAPRLVCEVSFQEWTSDGLLRQPVVLGLREDKPARSVRREIEAPVENEIDEKARHMASSKRKSEESTSARSQSSAAEPALTNLDKIYWPDEGYTKGDVIAYYRELAPVILPYLRDRPESLNRHPNGIAGKSFFQKNVGKQPPPQWVETVAIEAYGGATITKYLLCQDAASLLYLANLGCIELNPWNSRVGHLDHPDYAILDLDPVDIPFARVVEAALAARKVLDRVGAVSCCKTSGKRGLHIFVPLGARYAYEAARQFAQVVATIVHHQLPETTSIVRSPAQRQRRVYLDYLQNSRGQTLAAPYSLRPSPGATVSTPLEWREVKKTLDPTKFNINSIHRRLEKLGDLWEPVVQEGIDLEEVLTKLGANYDL
jgi:bifunctional non-homologous end joining protein LigD